jgi:hypothetical protein
MKAIGVIAFLAIGQPALAATTSETVTMIGGPLGPWEPEPIATSTRDHITVFGLPANWSAGMNICHTATLGQYKKLKFTFSDGNTTVAALMANGYVLVNNVHNFPSTSLTICRDGAGGVLSATAQIVAVGSSSSGALEIYEVGTTNSSTTQGYSFSSFSAMQDGHVASFSANSSAVNAVTIKN